MKFRACPSRVAHPGIAVLAALGTNLVLVLGLSLLNHTRPTPEPRSSTPPLVVIDASASQPLPPRDRREPDPPAEPETIAEIDLDVPLPAVEPLAALEPELELSLSPPVPLRLTVATSSPRPAPIERPASSSASDPTAAKTGSRRHASPAGTAPRTVSHLPRRLHAPPPRYPRRALRDRREGEVRIRLLIDRKGRVEDVRYLDGSREFRRAVDRVIRRWRFQPARGANGPIPVYGITTIRFTLGEGVREESLGG